MSDSFRRYFEGIDRPRPLTPQLHRLLEDTMADPEGLAPSVVLQGIDRPRALPTLLRVRIQNALTTPPQPAVPRLLFTAVAAVVALVLITGSVVWNNNRSKPLDSSMFFIEPQAAPAGSLVRFDSAGAFLSYIRQEALRIVGPHGLPGDATVIGSGASGAAMAAASESRGAGTEQAPSARPPSGYSTTNIQEAGVDEPDLIKTDGKHVVALAQGKLWVSELHQDIPHVRGSVVLATGDAYHDPGSVLLSGDRAIHITNPYNPEVRGIVTVVRIISISSPSSPEVVATLKFEGSQVGARLTGGRVRLVIQSSTLGPEMSRPQNDSPEAQESSLETNRQAISRSKLADWLPEYVLERPGHAPVSAKMSSWSESYRPPEPGSGLSILTVVTIDPANPRPDNAVSVVGAGQIVYASQRNLYVTTSQLPDLAIDQTRNVPQNFVTKIHKFNISDPSASRYVASGEVPGFLLNQFSMSEREDHLRVASTMSAPRGLVDVASESYVTVLSEREGRLVRVGSVGNLGRGERIFAVRFIGSMGYVVTFRQVDPLYVIDLRDPEKPRVRGELKVPGFSNYLHPISETLLLGIGHYVDDSGRQGGLQMSLFDVSDPDNPRRIHDRVLGAGGYSEVARDHHAFLYWPQRSLTVFPASIWQENGEQEFHGALVVGVTAEGGFGEPVRLTHSGREEAGPSAMSIRRSMIMGGSLITFSDDGVLTSDLGSFSDRHWFAYP